MRNGSITTDEVYAYIMEHVPKKSGQKQHPVKKGEGVVTIGLVH